MTSKTFTSGTVIDSGWLNDVNNTTYNKTFADGSVALSAQPGDALDSSAVSYAPAGTGAVPTTVQTKLRESVSVLNFGINTTPGTTDMTSAFNAAWTASNPKAVLVPAATYAITGTVTGKFYSFGLVTITGGTVTTIINLVP